MKAFCRMYMCLTLGESMNGSNCGEAINYREPMETLWMAMMLSPASLKETLLARGVDFHDDNETKLAQRRTEVKDKGWTSRVYAVAMAAE